MEWLGSFQVPNSGRKVGGRLVIDEHKSELTTFDELLPDPDRAAPYTDSDVNIPMVWGETHAGKRLTLLNVRSLGGTFFSGGWSRERWLCDAAIEERLEPEEPPTFLIPELQALISEFVGRGTYG